MPAFTSPFAWRLIAHLSNGYELRDVDLLAMPEASAAGTSTSSARSIRVPNQWTPAVWQAAHAPVAQVFLGFSRFPAARLVAGPDGTSTVHWSDMRFLMGPADDPREFRAGLFGATVVVGSDGGVLASRLGP